MRKIEEKSYVCMPCMDLVTYLIPGEDDEGKTGQFKYSTHNY